MKDKIQSIQQYFISKIVSGEFIFVSMEHPCVAKIQVDEEYTFHFWLHLNKTTQYNASGYRNFIELPKFTPEQHEVVFNLLKTYKASFDKQVLENAKLAQFNELQKELKSAGLI